MHIVILGCGRVGSLLADRLDEAGHSVAVVDQDTEAFRRLGSHFRGTTVTGVGFDRETLERAGIKDARAFAAVSSGDNTNILAARVARETYGVDHVVARIYDPRRAEVYQRLGIPTVATVSWTANQILRRLVPEGAEDAFRDATGAVAVAEIPVSSAWVGKRFSDLEAAAGVRVCFITRLGHALLPVADTVYQDGDLVHAAYETAARERVESILGSAPRAGGVA